MVFTSRIEVFGVKPDFHVPCMINSFHNDLFSRGTCIFGRNILVFSEEPCIQVPKRPPKATHKAAKVNSVDRGFQSGLNTHFGAPHYTQKALK